MSTGAPGQDEADGEFNDDAAAAWYAQAAEDDAGEDEEEEEEEEEQFEPDVPEAANAAEDPYLAVDIDPYSAVTADPYGLPDDAPIAIEEVTTTTTTTTTITTTKKTIQESGPAEVVAPTAEVSPPTAKLSGSGTAESVATATALAAAFTAPAASKVSEATQARRMRRAAAAAAVRPGEEVAPWRQPQRKVQKTHSQFVSSSTPPPAPPMPSVAPQAPPMPPVKPQEAPLPQPSLPSPTAGPTTLAPDPVPMQTDEASAVELPQTDMALDMSADASAEVGASAEGGILDEVADADQQNEVDLMMNEEDMSWDERVVVVRQGQVHIELQHRNPSMHDPALLRFCDWLDKQMPLVVENFPYVRKSGAYVDLSDNKIGSEGLDKLFRVLRDHQVPCVVMKAFRNSLDDSIVDTLIEYLHTQPESFPMHGIHISHNNITDKGAFRLIRAATQCGHYPRATSRLPLWLRLESNQIVNPQKVVGDCLSENFNVCLMKDGQCSRPDCNHFSNVHIQLPYFFNQSRNRVAKAAPAKAAPVKVEKMLSTPPSAPPQSAVSDPASPESQPDWMTLRSVPTSSVLKGVPAPLKIGVPAPKKQDFRPAPKVVGMQRQAYDDACKSRVEAMAAAVEVPSFEGGMAAPVDVPSLEANYMGFSGNTGSASSSFSGARPKLLSSTPKARAGAPEASFSWNAGVDEGDTWMSANFGGWGGGGKGGGFKQGGGKGKGKGDAWGEGGSGGWKSNWRQDWTHDGKGKCKGGGKGKGKKGKKGDWVGPTLFEKVKRDTQLTEVDVQLGFQWQYIGGGISPRMIVVDPYSKAGQIAQAGDSLLRINGLDAAMFTEKQLTDMLKQRPISIRVGDQ